MRTRQPPRVVGLSALAALLVAVAIAGAGLTAAATASPARAAARTAAAPSALTLTPENVNGSLRAVVSGASWQLEGVMTHYVPGQRVVIHAFDDGRRILAERVRLTRVGSEATFVAQLRAGVAGRVTVRAIHFATAKEPFIVSPDVSVWVVAPSVLPGQQDLAVRILQSQLAAHHYAIQATGVDDLQTQLAVLAFRKMANLSRTTVADASVFADLAAGDGTFAVAFPSHGRHVEADLTHQVLALIGTGGQVEALYTISSGKPSTPTQLGSFAVYEKTYGVNSDGMVDSSYFNGGDAIHGYAEVPPYPASHGCLRVPILDAAAIYAWTEIGTPVDVYYR